MEGHQENGWSSPHWSARRENRDNGGRGGGFAGGRGNPRDGSSGYQRQQNHYGNVHQQSQYHGERGSLSRGHQGRQHNSYGQQREGPGSQSYNQQYRNYQHQEHMPFIGFGAGPPPQFDAHTGPVENRTPGYMPYGHGPEPPLVPVPQRAPEYWAAQPHAAGAAYPYHMGVPHGMPAPYPQPPFPPSEQQQHHPYPQQYMQAPYTGDVPPPALHAAAPVGPPPQVPVSKPGYSAPTARPIAPPSGAWSQAAAASRGPEHGRGGAVGVGAGGGRKGAVRPPHVPQPLPVSATSSQEPASSGMNSLGRPRQRQSSSSVNSVQGPRPAPQAPTAQSQAAVDPQSSHSQSGCLKDEAGVISDATRADIDVGHTPTSQDATQSQAPVDAITAQEGGLNAADVLATATMAAAGRHVSPVVDVRVPSASQPATLADATTGPMSRESDQNATAAAATPATNHHAATPSPVILSTTQAVEARSAPSMAASMVADGTQLPAGPQAVEGSGSGGTGSSTPEFGVPLAVGAASSSPPQQQQPSQAQAAKYAATAGSAWKQRPATALFPSPASAAPAATAARQAASAAIDGRSPAGATAPTAVAAAVHPAAARANNRPPPVDVALPAPGHTRPPGPPPGFGVPQLPAAAPSTAEAPATAGLFVPSPAPGGAVSPSGRGSTIANGVPSNPQEEHPPQPRTKSQQQAQRQQPISPGKHADELSVQGTGSNAGHGVAEPPRQLQQPSQFHRGLTGHPEAVGGSAGTGPVSPSAEEAAAAPLTNWAAVLTRNASGPPSARSLRSTGSGGGGRVVTAASLAPGLAHSAPGGSAAAAPYVPAHALPMDAVSPAGSPVALAPTQVTQAAAAPGPVPTSSPVPTAAGAAPVAVDAVAPNHVPSESERVTHAVLEAPYLSVAAAAPAVQVTAAVVIAPAAVLPRVVSVEIVDVRQATSTPTSAAGGVVGEAPQALLPHAGPDTLTDTGPAMATAADTAPSAGAAASSTSVEATPSPSPSTAHVLPTSAAASTASEPTPVAAAPAPAHTPPSAPSSWAAVASKSAAAAARPGPRVAAAQGASPGGRGLGGGRHGTAPHGRASTLPPEELFRQHTLTVPAAGAAVAAATAGGSSGMAAASLSLPAATALPSTASVHPELAPSVRVDATTQPPLDATSLSAAALSVPGELLSAAAAASVDAPSPQLAAVTLSVQADSSGHEQATAKEQPPHAPRDTEWQDVHSRAKGGKGSGVSGGVQHSAQPGGTAAGRGRGRHGEAVRLGQLQPQPRQAQGRGQLDKPRQEHPPPKQQNKQGHPLQHQGHGHEQAPQAQASVVPLGVAVAGQPSPSPVIPPGAGATVSTVRATTLPTAVAVPVESAAAAHGTAATATALPSEPVAAAAAAETLVPGAVVQEEVVPHAATPAAALASDTSAVVISEVVTSTATPPVASSSASVAAVQVDGRKTVIEALKDKEDEEEEDAAGVIPAGRNPWDLLGVAVEDGDVTPAAAVTLVSPVAATTASAAAVTTSASDAMEALRQLLSPAASAAGDAGRQLLLSGGGGAVHIQPRGLVNTGNTCFINSTMQALLACGPFAAMLSRLPSVAPLLEPSKSPTLHGLALLTAELAVAAPAGAAAGSAAGSTASGGGSGPGDLPIMEEDGWAQVATGRGKKGGGSSRKSPSAYPALHAHTAIHNAATNAAVAASTGAAAPSATATIAAGPSAIPPAVLLGGKPLVPTMLNGIVAAFNPRISFAPRAAVGAGTSTKPSMAQMLSKSSGNARGLLEQQEQQDAQEFFLFLVNRAHEEVVALRKAHGLGGGGHGRGGSSGGAASGGADGEEWAQVGRKNKATVTRQVGTPADDAASRSPVSAIFSGLLKSTVRFSPPHGHYKPSATIEAFNMLHLDIAGDGIASLEDALRAHALPESIEYKPDGAPCNVPAKKDVRLYRLPEVLVLHLKRFTFSAAGAGGYCKLHKPVAFGSTLRLEGKMLAEDCPDRANAEYRLFATVVHHGRSIAGGHYTADVQQPDGRWLRFNDAVVDVVNEAAVLAERPYLLFYQRCAAAGTAGGGTGRGA